MVAIHARGARAPAPADPDQARLSHQPSNAFTAHPTSAFHQLGVYPRHPVGPSRIVVDTANHCSQLLVASGTTRRPTASPRVVPAGGDAQHSAHRGHPMMGLVRLHELEDLPGIVPVSRANQAAAFLNICLPSADKKIAIRALREAGGSRGEAAAAPRVLNSSNRPHDGPRPGQLDAPSCKSPGQSTRILGLAHRACDPFEPTRPSGADTPARTVDGFSTSDTSSAKCQGVHQSGSTPVLDHCGVQLDRGAGLTGDAGELGIARPAMHVADISRPPSLSITDRGQVILINWRRRRLLFLASAA